MSQSRPPSDIEEQRSSPPTPSKESANGTPVTDDQCPNLDDEVTAARGVGAFASTWPSTNDSVVFTQCPVQILLYHRSGNARHPSSLQPRILMILCVRLYPSTSFAPRFLGAL